MRTLQKKPPPSLPPESPCPAIHEEAFTVFRKTLDAGVPPELELPVNFVPPSAPDQEATEVGLLTKSTLGMNCTLSLDPPSNTADSESPVTAPSGNVTVFPPSAPDQKTTEGHVLQTKPDPPSNTADRESPVTAHSGNVTVARPSAPDQVSQQIEIKARRALFQEDSYGNNGLDFDILDPDESISNTGINFEGNRAELDLPVIVIPPSAPDQETTEGRVLYTEPDVPNDTVDAESFVTPPSGNKRKSRSRPCSSGRGSPKRKRPRNEHLWKANIRKDLKNSGQAYIDSLGKEHEAVQMRGPCTCSKDCRHRLKEDQRLSIHETFWRLGRHDRQWDFIRRNSSSKSTKTRRPGQVLKRQVSRSYHFFVGNDMVPVCKQMFMRTLGICDGWIDTAYKKVNPDKGNTVSPDKRGGFKKRTSELNAAKVDSVKEHVNLFPRIPSHYCRKRTKREYLEKGLTIAKMARLYQKWAEEKNLPRNAVATQRQYRDILNSNFNLGFFKPKKDQCSLCAIMGNKSNTRQIREEKKAAWVAHVKNKEKARALKAKDVAESMTDKTVVACSFDLQKQLSCPKSENGAYYYRSKLNLYNFTAFNMTDRVGDCFLWHEGIGKKGSNEISSSLLLYIKSLVRQGYTDIRFWSDNCAGQNKCRNLFAMYEYAAVKYNIKITHRYLEPGHTQMEADSIHARIEKVTEKEDIYDFDSWVKFIESAKAVLPMYRVKTLSKKSILSFKNLVGMQNWDVDLKRQPITWRKVRELHINSQEGNLVRMKYEFDSEGYISMSPNKAGRPVNLKNFQPSPAYESAIPLSANTIKDLTWLCDNYHVPVEKQTFLRSVLSGVEPAVEGEQVSDIEYESDEELCQEDEDVSENGEECSSEQEDDPS
ncbi:Dihydroxy-acid dehydratase [Frankliniella fusca]|uniref:Dihydroxy-acid dehydratase n=1 Tax=Frankliniella fusca TaxID=407009 RepID=A0AAE1HFY0_9NEOP|nr:Dihydroxy-acid dehydratase [Frankliniella fusca]